MEQPTSSQVDPHTFINAVHGFRYQVHDVAARWRFTPSILVLR
jgi:hypothetical protein